MSWQQECGSKIRYDTEAAARYALDHVPNGAEMDYYRCDICNGWHLGHHSSHGRDRVAPGTRDIYKGRQVSLKDQTGPHTVIDTSALMIQVENERGDTFWIPKTKIAA